MHVSNESDLRNAIQNQPAGTTIIVDFNFSTGTDELVFNKGFILDLNGKTITANNHIRVTDNWTLQIYDNSTAGTGTIRGRYPQGDGCAIYIDNGSTLEIFSGTIKGDVNSTYNGGVIYNAGTLTMYGGKITNGRALNGGGVYNTGTMTLGLNNNGGSIENCEAFFNGGGIYNTGTLTINRGTIGGFDETNNVSLGNSASEGGGIINDEGIININGGSISNNSAIDEGGGGISDIFGTININGGSISNNTAHKDGGGIQSFYSTIIMTGGSINGNRADTQNAGGVNLTHDHERRQHQQQHCRKRLRRRLRRR